MADIEAAVAVEVTNNDCVEMQTKIDEDVDVAKGLKRKLEESEGKLNGTVDEEKENGDKNGHSEDEKNGLPKEIEAETAAETKDSPVKKAKTDEEEATTTTVEKTESAEVKEGEAVSGEKVPGEVSEVDGVEAPTTTTESEVIETIAEDKVDSAETEAVSAAE